MDAHAEVVMDDQEGRALFTFVLYVGESSHLFDIYINTSA